MARSDLNGAASDGVRRRRNSIAAPALPASFYARPAEEVARDLLGCHLARTLAGEECVAEIVETEAYVGPHDDASHAAERFGRTARNDVMFRRPGLAYVYLIYGMHWCLNTVTDAEGFPAAVLLRAASPVEGLPVMRGHRPGRPDVELLRGPGNLCRALAVDGALNGHDLAEAPLRILPGTEVSDSRVARGPRVGISRAVEHPLRFWVSDSPAVSGRRSPPRP
jgi:DNA-3-methyladenine glycosylase